MDSSLEEKQSRSDIYVAQITPHLNINPSYPQLHYHEVLLPLENV